MQTLTILRRVDPSRKAEVLRFLIEAGLVQRVDGRSPIVPLEGANLTEISLIKTYHHPRADMSGADLEAASLKKAYLGEVNLEDANLRSASLKKADLSDANLSGANLAATDLQGTDLSYADLSDANLHFANFRQEAPSSLQDIPNVTPDLFHADLSGANLKHANLRLANLREANLSHATGMTDADIAQAARSLKGATMTNGQKYEDWIKNREED